MFLRKVHVFSHRFAAAICLSLATYTTHSAQAAPLAYQKAIQNDKPQLNFSFPNPTGDSLPNAGTLATPARYSGGLPQNATGSGLTSEGATTFNGTNQYVSIPNRQLGPSLSKFSLEFVLKTSSTARSTLLGVFDEGITQGISLDLNTNAQDQVMPGSTRFFLRDLTGPNQGALCATFLTEDANIYDGRYHHLLFTYNGSAPTQHAALQAFVDGAPIALSFEPSFMGVPRRFVDFSFNPSLAARNARGAIVNFAPVTLDEVAFYANTLPDATVIAHTRAADIPIATRHPMKLDELRQPNPAARAAFQKRANELLDFVVQHRDNPMKTVWGNYRNFDCYALACLALEGHDDDARRLLVETLDMIDHNFEVERAPGGDKWHLADFAMEPLLRGYFKYRTTHLPNDPVWERLSHTAQTFFFHYGDLSENHNLLHLSLRYLVGQTWPDATLADGHKGSVHMAEADADIRQWMNDWVRQGSTEWGADIYYNIDMLSLLNLYDFAKDPSMRVAAQGMLDLFALDEALDSYAGAAVGAARRGYGVYRMDIKQSPSRPLQYLWFNAPSETSPFNLNFIGGVIQAATSDYLPPAPIVWIANSRAPQENSTTHQRGLWPIPGLDSIGKHTLRLSDVMQSTMNSPGGGGRYTEHVWQITMNETALVFANHPTATVPISIAGGGAQQDLAQTIAVYSQPRPANPPVTEGAWYWTYANVPPGHQGDVRPGYWQGNLVGPRSFGTGSLSFLIFDIPADNPLPFAHLYLPRAEFDEVREANNWVYLRKGTGYAALWIPTGYTPTKTGLWADTEWKINGRQSAVLSFIGNAATNHTFDVFITRAQQLQPQWDAQNLTLSALPSDNAPRVTVSYTDGPSTGNQKIDTKGPRFQTPWGSMSLGTRTLSLKTPAGQYNLDLRAALR
ncbi:hypothetical protein IAD21_06359 [Abditibacteriota bacterium]|nr:hypothetical protein IAD21_06359 [Abditibacteriota bacterium]